MGIPNGPFENQRRTTDGLLYGLRQNIIILSIKYDITYIMLADYNTYGCTKKYKFTFSSV